MRDILKYVKNGLMAALTVAAICSTALAQTDPLTQARVHAEKKEYKQAADIYKRMYNQNPTDPDVYGEYLDLLLTTKDLKEAERIIKEQLQIRPQYPAPYIDMGRVYLVDGKTKKAEDEFNKALDNINGDDMITQQMAATFTKLGRDDYAIKTFERASELLRNPILYGNSLARLYAKNGQVDKAVQALLETGPMLIGGTEDTKATLLEFLGTDKKNLLMAQKTLIKKINEQPENPFFSDLLTWLYTQKNDWDGAMIQIQALDERYREHGQRMLEFARMAEKEKQYDFAIKSYDAIIQKGKEQPFYGVALSERLYVSFQKLKNNPAFTKEEVLALAKDYESFFAEFPQYYTNQTLNDYAELEARYADNPKNAIALLKKAIAQPMARKDFIGMSKLQMGDYHILTGSNWEAMLLYMQVDKDFREDALGEDARFRNAKLSYYQGDFEYAQGQLSVLKQSTTELIANDALHLSVLITENMTPDSNLVPLKRFAYADLLVFQNKDTQAEALLDSITKAYPEHPLKDDILMQRSVIALKHKDYIKSLNYLKEVYDKHGDDVLGDDALFKTGEINEQYLHQPEQAKKFYEELILKYPGSTYVQVARKRLYDLQNPEPATP